MSERAADGAAHAASKAPKDPSIQLSVDDEIATVQTTASTTKKKEDMRNESTGITVGDSTHTLSDVRGARRRRKKEEEKEEEKKEEERADYYLLFVVVD